MRLFLLVALFFASQLQAEDNEKYNSQDATGYFLINIKKQCDTYQFEYEEYRKKALNSCKEKGMSLLEYDAAFAPDCKAIYTFKCNIEAVEKLRNIELKKKTAEQVEKNKLNKQIMIEEQLKNEKLAIIEKAKAQCNDLGFKKDSDKFKDCILELIK
jgi:hypothetical protein